MLRSLTASIVQCRGIKHQVQIKWVRPDYVPSYKPEKSGDLENIPKITDDTLGQDYALSEEIKDAPESVKKIFSVSHLGFQAFKALAKKELTERVRRHQYDEDTTEYTIARLTAHIRCLQHTMEKYPKNIKAKQTCQELIDKRKKHLKFLRQYDYKKFEWLLEKLNIEYKGHPETYNKLSRKESLRKLTELHCDEIRNKKLHDYRNLLESQQGPFLKEKLEALKFIKSEQMELKLPITVTDQDIKKVEIQLEEWKVKDEIKQQAKKKKRHILLEESE
ncbi:unnamed protein product [Diatraea saccharalis]|uniref:Small ribosomal subunit protein uS15m n=1 Tax=Diatraea saccharalis TaxID=40085 RepID=A0A9N9R827_9NEOP|nr:unnamed protein product [Diatraea saccharalis]